jgi:acyl-[acyl-carrier-protein] desaturase
VGAIWDVVSTFQMPGNTIEGFTRRSVQIAMAGIHDLRIHRDEVLAPILRSWDVWDRVGLSGEGEQAREQLGSYSRSWIDKRAGSRRDAPRVRLARKQRR